MITVDLKRIGLTNDCQAGPRRILDMGCGPGRHCGAVVGFKNRFVVGADLSFGDLIQARQRMNHLAQWGEVRGTYSLSVADITRLPFADDAFDAVICAEVLEHIPDHRRAASELLRVLRPGGSLVVSVPRFWPERICWRLSCDYPGGSGGHIRIYRAKRIASLISEAGARFRAQHHAHSLHTPYWWLKCLLGLQRENHPVIRLYNRLLVWDIMQRPRLTRALDYLLNPLLGKSIVLYFEKAAGR